MEKTRIFFDMDGVLAEWNSSASIEEVSSPGYFRKRVPMQEMISAVKSLLTCGDVEVYILSAVYVNVYSNLDKYKWLREFLPEMPDENIIFVPYGEAKRNYIPDPKSTDVLIDDYSKNLFEWHGVGVKCINGINNTHGTWLLSRQGKGMYIDAGDFAENIVESILDFCA